MRMVKKKKKVSKKKTEEVSQFGCFYSDYDDYSKSCYEMLLDYSKNVKKRK